jgi:isatin hydrolase
MTEVTATTAVPSGADPGYEVVDLSLLIAEDLPCYWATHLPFQHKTWNWYRDEPRPAGNVYSRSGPYATRWMAIDEHTATHVDAPSHFIPPPDSGLPHAGAAGATSVEQVPLTQLMGPAAVVDAGALVGTIEEGGISPVIEPELITDWEAANGPIRPGDIVLFRTGWDARYQRGAAGAEYVHDVVVTGRQPGWPAPDVPAMEVLLERGVRCVGIDTPTMGPAQGGQAVHVCALGEGAVFIECLTGLHRLPARGAWFCFLPIKVEGGTGAPGRAVAWVPVSAPGQV